MPTVADLNQRHPSVDQKETARLHALYHGGKPFDALLSEFLPQRPAEAPGRYDLRKKEAHYRNYLGPIVDYFASLLFAEALCADAKDANGKPVELDDFYARFLEDADGNGCDLNELAKAALTEAAVKRCSWMRLEQATDGGVPADNAKDFKERGLGDVWIHRVPTEQVYDWDVDDDGNLLWAVVHSLTALRSGLSGNRRMVTECWEYLTPAGCETYRIVYDVKKPPKNTDSVPQIGTMTSHRFGAVPLVPLHLPPALWIANRLATPQLAHFRLSNAHTWGLQASCFAQPVFKTKRDDNGVPRQPVMGAGYGIMLGIDESMEWVAPPAAPFDSLANEIKAQKDEIYRIAHQMALGVENNAAAIGRTAESKAKDAEATRVVLIAFSKAVREFVERIYGLVSAARGESYEWSISGLDDFAALDAGGLMGMLVNLEKAGGIPSPTFEIQMKSRLAASLLGDVDESVKETIEDEIEDSILGDADADEPDEPVDEDTADIAKMHAVALKIANGKPGPKPRRNRSRGKAQPGKPVGGRSNSAGAAAT